MAYREDQDALLARNDALEEENARLKEELAAAKAPKPAPPKPAPASKPSPSPRLVTVSWPKIFGWLFGAAAAAGVFWLMIFYEDPETRHDRDDRAHERDLRVHERLNRRWRSIVMIEPCLDQVSIDLHYALLASPDHFDPRAPTRDQSWIVPDRQLGELTETCDADLALVAMEPGVDADARAALLGFAGQTHHLKKTLAPLIEYLANDDWKDDGYAGAHTMWERDARPAIATWRAAYARARDLGIPATRAIIARAADAREQAAGGDTAWWRLHVGLAYRDLMAACVAVIEPPAEAAAPLDRDGAADALVGPVARMQAAIEGAPLEIRRAYRDFDDPVAYVRGENDPVEGLSNLIISDQDLIKATASDDTWEVDLPPY